MAQADATAGDNRLLPLMREAVLMVRMLLHRQLLQDFAAQRPELAPEDRVRLAGALINDLFGTVPADEGVVAFAWAQRALVETAMRGLAAHSGKLRPLITDALRMHCICDGQEGVNTTASLLNGQGHRPARGGAPHAHALDLHAGRTGGGCCRRPGAAHGAGRGGKPAPLTRWWRCRSSGDFSGQSRRCRRQCQGPARWRRVNREDGCGSWPRP